MTRRFVLCERPEREVSPLWEMWSSSSAVREERPVMEVSRFAWMERILRLVRVSKPYCIYVLVVLSEYMRYDLQAYLDLLDLVLA